MMTRRPQRAAARDNSLRRVTAHDRGGRPSGQKHVPMRVQRCPKPQAFPPQTQTAKPEQTPPFKHEASLLQAHT